MTDPPAATARTAVDEVVGLGDTVLEQVGASVGPVLEQGEGVAGRGELAEHDHTGGRVALAESGGGADAFVGAGRRHADVGHDDVGCELVDEGDQLVERSGDAGTERSSSAASRRETASRTR